MASFPTLHGPVSARSPTGRKRGTRKSRLETNPKNEARSALLARLWCHLSLQNPANRAENLIRLCSATIGQTGWRMVQFGAIRSRLETMRNRELTGNLGLFCADLGVFPPCNSLYFEWLDGDSLFRKNREFQMTDQGIALDETGN